jgi:protocadherin delta 1
MLIALDGGTPPLSGSLEINIVLTDANDNAPQFAQAQYETNVPENTRPGTTLVLLSAADNDQGLNGRVTYLLDPSTTGRDATLFRVDNVTGALLLIRSLDYELSRTHTLSVIAKDGGLQPQSAIARVVISIDDVNDVAPIVVFSTMQQQASNTGNRDSNEEGTQQSSVVEVMENLPSGTFVAQMTATDADTGDGGKVACQVASDSDRLFSLQKTSVDNEGGGSKNTVEYRVVTNTQLDRENQDSHRVRIVCSDSGQPRLSSTSTLVVNVGDQNDNAPFFLRQVYHVMLAENNAIGDIVTAMNASDQDVGNNARLTYSIAFLRRNNHNHVHQHSHGPLVRDLLSIEPRTGVIRALVKFDYESAADREGYLFRVTVMDSGEPVRSAVTTLNLTIQDMNDEYPVFKEERYVFFVKENTPPPSDVGVIEATDGDGPRYSQIVYSIHHQDGDRSVGSSGRRFAVDAYTGRLVTIRPLDRELQATHTLVVQASNPLAGSSESSIRDDVTIASFVNVTVVVLDENDNAPVFRNPSLSNSTVVVRNDVPVGYVVTRLLAVDPDMGGGGTVTYAIVSGNDDGNFHVDTVNGELTTSRFLTSYVNNVRKLTVSAQDAETPPRSTLAILYVHVAQRGSAAAKALDEQQQHLHDDSALTVSHQSTHLTFTIVVVIGVLGGLLVIAISSIVLAVLCLNSRRQRQRLKVEREAKKSAEEAAALLFKVASDERQRASAAGTASPATTLLWNSSCQQDDNDTMDILRVSSINSVYGTLILIF